MDRYCLILCRIVVCALRKRNRYNVSINIAEAIDRIGDISFAMVSADAGNDIADCIACGSVYLLEGLCCYGNNCIGSDNLVGDRAAEGLFPLIVSIIKSEGYRVAACILVLSCGIAV